VATSRSPAITDVSGAALRLSSIAIGIRVLLGMCAADAAYAVATRGQPHRLEMGILLGVGVASSVIIALLPVERIVRSHHGDLFFLAWSVFQIALVAGLAGFDGGARSPLALAFIIPVLFAAVSYPLWAVVVVGALDVLSFLGLDAVTGPSDPGYLCAFAGAMAISAVLCAWQAANQDEQRQGLARVSRTDLLTGSLNRRGFEERLDAGLAAATRAGEPLALIVFNLDGFKGINDAHGHPAGDELLRWTVATMHDVVRPTDDVGRLGGDEFAVLLPGVSRTGALGVAARITGALGERVTASVGVTAFPEGAADREGMFSRADAKLYEAKHGRPDARAHTQDLGWAAALAHAVDARMATAHEHSSAVAEYAAAVAGELGWSQAELGLLRMAAMLHDVGKVSVPDHILRKRGPLTSEEFAEVAKHPVTGSEIVARIGSLTPIVPWIRHAHEHWNGAGYPDGLSGETIPLASRILLVSDAFDAMTSDRPYRRALTHDEALAELRAQAGRQFDPRCVAILDEYLTLQVRDPEDLSRA
jgi:diguanylate cyclase (GGDEF)-like protein/putative nucleotidyltransferase with HDIG domain